jgi:hypothetical protein
MIDLSGPKGFLRDQLKKLDRHPLRRKKAPPYVIAEMTPEARDGCEKICKNCSYFSRIEWNAAKNKWCIYCTAKMVAYQPKGIRYFQNRWCPTIYANKFKWPTQEKADEIYDTCVEKAKTGEVYDEYEHKWVNDERE